MRSLIFGILVLLIGGGIGVSGVIYWQKTQIPNSLFTPDATAAPEPERPLLAYSFPQLRQTTVKPAIISLVEEDVLKDDRYRVFTYTSDPLDRKMSGVINLPNDISASTSAILMLRGWVPPNQYAPGVGTKNVAAELAKAGFVTIAPDFFGYGDSDPEPTDEWQARFEKPLIAKAVIDGLRSNGIILPDSTTYMPTNIGIWGHSNGGQIALATLVAFEEELPTSLWAPVSAPFPYSILYFSDEEEDEGQASRKWISIFEKQYDARQFSLTNYLDGLRGPLQIQQGTNDDAVLKWWSEEFVQKIAKENLKRAEQVKAESDSTASSSESAGITDESVTASSSSSQQPIHYSYIEYPGADHNLRPDWSAAVAKDIEFFSSELIK